MITIDETKNNSVAANVQPSSDLPAAISQKQTRKNFHFISAGICGILLIAIISIIVFVFYEQKSNNTTLTSSDEDTGNIISRQKWFSRRLNENIPKLQHPVKYVLICHTVGRFCESVENCSFVLRWMQNRSMNELKKLDLPYNFLVGGDGNVYEGRGWYFQNEFRVFEQSLAIAFIGNYVYYDFLTEKMVNATKSLLMFGVENGFLDESYLIVPQNHTAKTMSPGEHVYREIKTWMHFSTDLIF